MKTEILPKYWVMVCFVADKVGAEHIKQGVWLEGEQRFHTYQDYVYIDWVVFGTKAEAKAKIERAWEQARAGANLALKEVRYYANNYKPDSRRLIAAGKYTE